MFANEKKNTFFQQSKGWYMKFGTFVKLLKILTKHSLENFDFLNRKWDNEKTRSPTIFDARSVTGIIAIRISWRINNYFFKRPPGISKKIKTWVIAKFGK